LEELGFDVVFIELRKRFLRNLPEIVGCDLLFGWFAYPDAALYARILRRMSILNAVGHEVAYYPEFNYGLARRTYMRPFIALGLKSADKVIAESSESAGWARFWSRKKVEIIYEGIDTGKFKPLGIPKNSNDHILLAVATLRKDIVPRKNLATLINALKVVVEQVENAKLTIVGEKLDGYPSLREQVEELGLEDHVVFTGKISEEELVRLYNMCDVFVMPSLQEGFPTVCCEALSCGTPVITSDRPSMNEVFTNNVNAILTDPEDHVKMAKAIVKVLRNSSLATRLGKKGRELIVKNFSRDARKEKLNKAIIEVINQRRETRGIDIPFLLFYLAASTFLSAAKGVTRILRR
jgi:glycosyltransferase involved in cell wall biosynthesis